MNVEKIVEVAEATSIGRAHVLMPRGYQLITNVDAMRDTYGFKRPNGVMHDEWFTWKVACVDAMWEDVRARATREATMTSNEAREAKNSLVFAQGYVQGKFMTDEAVRRTMGKAGYKFDPQLDAVATIEKLLTLLNGK
jgi:hypothetical protein